MTTEERNKQILDLYVAGETLTATIAATFGLTPRQVQRIVKLSGLSRTKGESNRLLAEKKNYTGMKTPQVILDARRLVSEHDRKMTLQNFPECSVCGIKRFHGTRLEVIHNKVVCYRCILKKKHF